MRTTLIIIGVILLVLILLGLVYYFFIREKSCRGLTNPGVGAKCKCDQGGDDTSRFYGNNWRARGAVCDGLYIPSAINLGGQDPVKVLEQMENLYSSDNSLKNDMNQLALTALNKTVS